MELGMFVTFFQFMVDRKLLIISCTWSCDVEYLFLGTLLDVVAYQDVLGQFLGVG
jgi:hypothetical protein